MGKKRTVVMVSVMVVCCVLILGMQSGYTQTTLEKIKTRGSIVVGYSNETPFAYAKTDGTLVGADVEILDYIMKKMGVGKMEGGLTEFGSLIPGLLAKRFDLITSAIYIKPDRCKQVAFSEILYIVGDTIVVPKGNPKNIHSFRDVVANPKIKLGMPTGGTGMSDKAIAMGVKPEQFVMFPDLPSGFAAVLAGRVDGYLTTGMTGETQLRAMNDPRLERAAPFEQAVIDGKVAYGIIGFAIRLEDTDLLAEINKHLLAFRGTPSYIAILEKYAMTKDDLPTTETTAKACSQ